MHQLPDFDKLLPDGVFVKQRILHVNEVRHFEDKAFTLEFCQSCPNYNKIWVCPPFAPTFGELSKNYDHLHLAVFYIYMDSIAEEEDKINTGYKKVKTSGNQFMATLEQNLNGLLITGNHCEICRLCTIVNKKPCSYPDKMRYNFTSLGLNMAGISKNLLNHPLQWPEKGNTPKYISSFAGVLLKKNSF